MEELFGIEIMLMRRISYFYFRIDVCGVVRVFFTLRFEVIIFDCSRFRGVEEFFRGYGRT